MRNSLISRVLILMQKIYSLSWVFLIWLILKNWIEAISYVKTLTTLQQCFLLLSNAIIFHYETCRGLFLVHQYITINVDSSIDLIFAWKLKASNQTALIITFWFNIHLIAQLFFILIAPSSCTNEELIYEIVVSRLITAVWVVKEWIVHSK